MSDSPYMSVGQLARRVGVTVRTIQYYDQQGLLTPAAKGPQNQRLYAESSVGDLCRIFVLKYLGLTLSEIKRHLSDGTDPEAFRGLFDQTLSSLEEDFQVLLRRITVLRSLSAQANAAEPIDWESYVEQIERGQGDDHYFWHLTGISESVLPEEDGEVEPESSRSVTVTQWHDLIADILTFRSQGIAPDDPRTEDLAQRYRALSDERGEALGKGFILMDNVTPHGMDDGSFDELRKSVSEYLEAAAVAHCGAAPTE